jgi:nicotinate dehydrogenase subunit B
LRLITADTSLTPNERYTSGSHSMQDSGTAILNAAAQVRQILIAEAARRAEVPADQLRTEGGSVIAPGGRRYRYGELVAGQRLHVVAASQSALKDPNQYAVMGHPIRRVDIPAKVTGGAAYVQDMRLAGMVHARIVRPPSYGAELVGVATEAVEAMPGVVKVVRDGSFLGVIAEKEFQAIEAMRALTAAAQWREIASLPEAEKLTRFSHPLAGTRHPGAGGGKSRRSDGEDNECDLYATLPGARCDRAIVRGCVV